MERTSLNAPTAHGELGGWVAGTGPEVLALHGGPGLSYDYLDEPLQGLLSTYRVASFQQRGLAPSTTTGPFTLTQAVTDVLAVLDHLGWQDALLLGHSWGGHLGLHVAVSSPGRVRGLLAVDPIGAVGDGGGAAFGAALRSRVSPASRDRLDELEHLPETVESATEQLSLLWPGYFATPAASPPVPAFGLSVDASNGLWPEIAAAMPVLEAALPGITCPVGVVVGAQSPMPPDLAGGATAERIPGAWLDVVSGAGHFVWHERPGCLRDGLDRLTA